MSGRRVLLGVCGGIAAYKAAALVSRLVQRGHELDVIVTDEAQRFVGPLTFAALTRRHVWTSLWERPEEIPHIALVRAADAFAIVPATANVIAKLAHGIADNLLTTCALATRRPIIVAAAMNTAMYEAQATRENIAALQDRGYRFIAPGAGFLACGEIGEGRLAGDDAILDAVRSVLGRARAMEGQCVLVTAGPTREFADPARFLSNPSTGRMGLAIAAEAVARGARVTVVCGPTELRVPHGIDVVRVTSAREMHAAVLEHLPGTTLFIGAAAVADFRPSEMSAVKAKKESLSPTLECQLHWLRFHMNN